MDNKVSEAISSLPALRNASAKDWAKNGCCGGCSYLRPEGPDGSFVCRQAKCHFFRFRNLSCEGVLQTLQAEAGLKGFESFLLKALKHYYT
jgi:hypothetical protein